VCPKRASVTARTDKADIIDTSTALILSKLFGVNTLWGIRLTGPSATKSFRLKSYKWIDFSG